MKLRLLFSALAAFALLGGGCARETPSITPQPATEATPQAEAPTGTTPVAEAPALFPEATAPTPEPTPPLTTPKISPPPAPLPPSKPVTHAVAIENFQFGPATLTVKVGDTVTWTQKDSIPHNVVSDEGNVLGSALLNQGQSFSHTFTAQGTFPYHCQPHPRMKATVVVQ